MKFLFPIFTIISGKDITKERHYISLQPDLSNDHPVNNPPPNTLGSSIETSATDQKTQSNNIGIAQVNADGEISHLHQPKLLSKDYVNQHKHMELTPPESLEQDLNLPKESLLSVSTEQRKHDEDEDDDGEHNDEENEDDDDMDKKDKKHPAHNHKDHKKDGHGHHGHHDGQKGQHDHKPDAGECKCSEDGENKCLTDDRNGSHCLITKEMKKNCKWSKTTEGGGLITREVCGKTSTKICPAEFPNLNVHDKATEGDFCAFDINQSRTSSKTNYGCPTGCKKTDDEDMLCVDEDDNNQCRGDCFEMCGSKGGKCDACGQDRKCCKGMKENECEEEAGGGKDGQYTCIALGNSPDDENIKSEQLKKKDSLGGTEAKNDEEDAEGLGNGAIIGIVCGCVGGVALIAALSWFVFVKKKGGPKTPVEGEGEAAAEAGENENFIDAQEEQPVLPVDNAPEGFY